MFKVVSELSVESFSTLDTASKAVRIWRDRPNVVNRRLCGSSDIWTQNRIQSGCRLIDIVVQKLEETHPNLSLEYINHFKAIFGVVVDENDAVLCKDRTQADNCSNTCDDGVSTFSSEDNECALQSSRLTDQNNSKLVCVVVRKLLPRSLAKFKTTLEVVATMKELDSGRPSLF